MKTGRVEKDEKIEQPEALALDRLAGHRADAHLVIFRERRDDGRLAVVDRADDRKGGRLRAHGAGHLSTLRCSPWMAVKFLQCPNSSSPTGSSWPPSRRPTMSRRSSGFAPVMTATFCKKRAIARIGERFARTATTTLASCAVTPVERLENRRVAARVIDLHEVRLRDFPAIRRAQAHSECVVLQRQIAGQQHPAFPSRGVRLWLALEGGDSERRRLLLRVHHGAGQAAKERIAAVMIELLRSQSASQREERPCQQRRCGRAARKRPPRSREMATTRPSLRRFPGHAGCLRCRQNGSPASAQSVGCALAAKAHGAAIPETMRCASSGLVCSVDCQPKATSLSATCRSSVASTPRLKQTPKSCVTDEQRPRCERAVDFPPMPDAREAGAQPLALRPGQPAQPRAQAPEQPGEQPAERAEILERPRHSTQQPDRGRGQEQRELRADGPGEEPRDVHRLAAFVVQQPGGEAHPEEQAGKRRRA